MKEFVISEAKVETAVIVGLVTPDQNERKTKEYLDELEFLADTAGAKVIRRFTQKVNGPNSVTYIGSGKLAEIKQFIQDEEDAEREVGMVIFDDELSAKQIRNIEHELQIKILDRTSLILDIFAMRAQRKNRGRLIRVALVGYTNVGKSTLMNLLSKSEVFAENKLFATLDTTVRKVIIDNLPFLLSDTVGFIRKLPTDLVDSFKSTLDEVREADLLIHLVDISHPDFEEQIRVVEKTLADLGASDKPILLVFNKIDAYTWTPKDEDDLTPKTKENVSLEELMATWMAKMNDNCFFISAKTGEHIKEFKELAYKKIRELHVQKYPYNDFLFQHYETEDKEQI